MAEDDKAKEKKLTAQIQKTSNGNVEKIHISNGFYFKTGLTLFFVVSACILFYFMIQRYEGFANGWDKMMKVAQPIIIGMVIAYLLMPIMSGAEKILYNKFFYKMKNQKRAKTLSRGFGIFFALALFLGILVIIIVAVAPSVYNSIWTLIEILPTQVKNLINTIENSIVGGTEATDFIADTLTKATNYIEEWARNDLLPNVQKYISEITTGVYSIIKVIINFFIGLFVAAYVMMIHETLVGQSKKILFAIFPPKAGNVIVHTVRKSSEIFGGFIVGKLIDSLIIGIICYIVCLILHIPSPVLIAVIIGITNIIPFFGPFFGAIPALLIVVIQSPWHALYLLIAIIVLQQVDGNIIGPKILGNSTGLSSFWVMFAILVFGGLWGFFGMLLGVPIMAVLYYIIGKLARHGLAKRELPTATDEYVYARGVNVDTNTLRYATVEETDEPKKNGFHTWISKFFIKHK